MHDATQPVNEIRRPPSVYGGLVPTLNHRGFMSAEMDYYARRFVEFAGSSAQPVLDIGCAYGIATRAALEAGAEVVACDMEQGHLDVLLNETPDELRSRLTTQLGVLPGIEFRPGSFGAILCSRLLHFLVPDEIAQAMEDMHDWLAPGGRVFLVADTPYTGFWSSLAGRYEERKRAGDEWPGFIDDLSALLTREQIGDMLPYLNPLDPDILRRECERAGLVVVECSYSARDGTRDGNAHAGVIAATPERP